MTRVRLVDPSELAESSALVDQLAEGGNLINLYRVMAHSPPALERFYALAGSLWESGLSARIREVAILSTVSALRASYPLAWHVGDGRVAGLSDEEIQVLVSGDDVSALGDEEAQVARFARQLTTDAHVDDALFAAVSARMDERELVELTLLVGLYNLVGRMANGLQVELDDEAASLLKGFGPQLVSGG